VRTHWSKLSERENFIQKAEADPNTGCWLWAGCVHANGYGKVKVAGKTGLAHRHAWQLFCGDIPAGKIVCHRCDTPLCVNPAHLYVGTDADNSRDKIARGRDRKATGTDAAHAKLDWSAVAAIRASGLSCAKLGAVHGVNPSTIWDARRGATWRQAARTSAPSSE
jgi:hypothetical protein